MVIIAAKSAEEVVEVVASSSDPVGTLRAVLESPWTGWWVLGLERLDFERALAELQVYVTLFREAGPEVVREIVAKSLGG